MSNDTTLLEIACLANALATDYPKSHRNYTTACRWAVDLEARQRAGENVGKLSEQVHKSERDLYRVCEGNRQELHRLAALLIQAMPDVARTCRHVARGTDRWYESADTNWDSIVGELRTIEVEAERRAAGHELPASNSAGETAHAANCDGVSHRHIRVGAHECDLSKLDEAICRAVRFDGNDSIDIAELSQRAWHERYRTDNRKKISTALSKLSTKLGNAEIGWSFHVRGDVVQKEQV